jgi:formate hydrogenlyase transcriptional activator
MTSAHFNGQATATGGRHRALLAVSEAIVSHRDLSALFHELASRLHQVARFDHLALHLYEAESDTVRLHVLEPSEPAVLSSGISFPLGESPAGLVLQTQQRLIISNVTEETRWPRFREVMRPSGGQSCCQLPLTTARRRLGTISFVCKQPAAYDAADLGFLQLVANQVALAVENALAFQEIEALKDKLSQEKGYLEQEVRTQQDFGEIVGESPALRRVLKQLEAVAPTESTVLILGETGTGKELVARALHDLSPRRERTFVNLNCAAIPTGLLESELFGHEKGAFTGAISQKVGRFQLAHQGTLFLDEIGDIPPELQPKLLRVLQQQEFERLGGTRTIKVDVRLVAATNRDLARMVADGRFRSDLYYRLNVFPLVLPPLRERPDDIPQLVRHFTQRFARRMGRRVETIPTAVMDGLVRYPWPGNIREMQNVIERAVVLSQGPALQVPLGDLEIKGQRSEVRGQPSHTRGRRWFADLWTYAGRRRTGAHPQRCPRNRLGAGWPEGGGRPPGDESLHVAMEDEKARHLPAEVVAARCQPWPPVATRPLAPLLPPNKLLRRSDLQVVIAASLARQRGGVLPRWNGTCFSLCRHCRKRSMSAARAFKTRIDLPADRRQKLVALLNQHLADTFDLYSQIKQAHWNVKGTQFYQLHELFDDLADQVEDHVDEIAERATALGGTALGTVSLVAGASRLTEYPLDAEGSLQHVEALAVRFAALAATTRSAIDAANELGDADTADLFTEVSRELDKGLWLLEAHLQA